MKAKLLKRIRRRFGYYKNDKDQYVIVDKVCKRLTVVTKELVFEQCPYYKTLDFDEELVYFNFLKDRIARPFVGEFYNKVIYNYGARKIKRKQNVNIL